MGDRIIKQELPLASDKAIASLIVQFENCTLPYVHWTHRAHLAVAIFYSRNYDFEKSLARIRERIHAYNHACGDPAGYNETITVIFLKKMYAEQRQPDFCQAMHEELKRLTQMCNIDWLYRYYSRDLIWSDAAKQQWIEPNITTLDF